MLFGLYLFSAPNLLDLTTNSRGLVQRYYEEGILPHPPPSTAKVIFDVLIS